MRRKEGYNAVVELLLARGAAVDSKNAIGQTPLKFAAQEGHESMVKLLLARGAAVDSKNAIGQTP